MHTALPSAWYAPIRLSLSSGLHSACTSRIPSCPAMNAAAFGLSPVSSTASTFWARMASTIAALSPRTVSASAM